MKRIGKGWTALAALFACAFLVVSVPSCTTDAEVAAERAAAVERQSELSRSADDAAATIGSLSKAIEDLRAEQSDLAARAARLDPDDPTRAATDAAIAAIRTRVESMDVSLRAASDAEAKARAAAAEIGQQIKASDAALADTSVDAGASAAAEILSIFIPGLAAASPAIVGLYAGFRRRGNAKAALVKTATTKSRALEKVVNSIDAVIAAAPAVRDAFKDPAIRSMLDRIQTPEVKAEVDRIQGKATAKTVNVEPAK